MLWSFAVDFWNGSRQCAARILGSCRKEKIPVLVVIVGAFLVPYSQGMTRLAGRKWTVVDVAAKLCPVMNIERVVVCHSPEERQILASIPHFGHFRVEVSDKFSAFINDVGTVNLFGPGRELALGMIGQGRIEFWLNVAWKELHRIPHVEGSGGSLADIIYSYSGQTKIRGALIRVASLDLSRGNRDRFVHHYPRFTDNRRIAFTGSGCLGQHSRYGIMAVSLTGLVIHECLSRNLGADAGIVGGVACCFCGVYHLL